VGWGRSHRARGDHCPLYWDLLGHHFRRWHRLRRYLWLLRHLHHVFRDPLRGLRLTAGTSPGVAPTAASAAVLPAAGAAVPVAETAPEEEELCEKEIYSE
jgi:hypothetical protein